MQGGACGSGGPSQSRLPGRAGLGPRPLQPGLLRQDLALCCPSPVPAPAPTPMGSSLCLCCCSLPCLSVCCPPPVFLFPDSPNGKSVSLAVADLEVCTQLWELSQSLCLPEPHVAVCGMKMLSAQVGSELQPNGTEYPHPQSPEPGSRTGQEQGAGSLSLSQ